MQIERKLQLMIEQKEHFHGSDLEKIEKIYSIKKENISEALQQMSTHSVNPVN